MDEIEGNATIGGLSQLQGADVLGAVIAADDYGFATSFDDPVKRANDVIGRQWEIDLKAEPFTVVVVDHIE